MPTEQAPSGRVRGERFLLVGVTGNRDLQDIPGSINKFILSSNIILPQEFSARRCHENHPFAWLFALTLQAHRMGRPARFPASVPEARAGGEVRVLARYAPDLCSCANFGLEQNPLSRNTRREGDSIGQKHSGNAAMRRLGVSRRTAPAGARGVAGPGRNRPPGRLSYVRRLRDRGAVRAGIGCPRR